MPARWLFGRRKTLVKLLPVPVFEILVYARLDEATANNNKKENARWIQNRISYRFLILRYNITHVTCFTCEYTVLKCSYFVNHSGNCVKA